MLGKLRYFPKGFFGQNAEKVHYMLVHRNDHVTLTSIKGKNDHIFWQNRCKAIVWSESLHILGRFQLDQNFDLKYKVHQFQPSLCVFLVNTRMTILPLQILRVKWSFFSVCIQKDAKLTELARLYLESNLLMVWPFSSLWTLKRFWQSLG